MLILFRICFCSGYPDIYEGRFLLKDDTAHLRCPACGSVLEIAPREVISHELAAQWNLSPEELVAVNRREGDVCMKCGVSRRLWSLASVIMGALDDRFGVRLACMADMRAVLGQHDQSARIWECNNLSMLHRYFEGIPQVHYTEFANGNASVPSVNLLDIPFEDASLDMIIMTDVLEHVPDVSRALSELYRVLRINGVLVFTVPMLLSRATRQRALSDGKGGVEHLLPPSYHGDPREKRDDLLVYYEFGGDFVNTLQQYFGVCRQDDAELADGIGSVFLCTKIPLPGSSCSDHKGEQEKYLEQAVLEKSWFYPFELPSGKIVDQYIPAEIQPIHHTRREMMWSALVPLFDGRWQETTAIDLACNQGYYAIELAAKGCARVLGIEARADTVAEADLMRRCLGLENVRFTPGDVLSLTPGEIGTYDIVLMFGLLYHLENPFGALRLAKALTRKVLLIETQVGPDSSETIDWGHSSAQQTCRGAFYVVDETQQGNNALASITGIALCPSLNALVWILNALGFGRVEVIKPPTGGYEQFERMKRIMVAAYC